VSARQAESSGRFEEALDCYERAQNLNPWDVRKARATALFLEKLYLSTGDMAWRTRSDDVWEKVCDLEPLDGDLAFEKARRETERVVVERTALSLRSAAESWKVARTALPFSAEVCEAEGDFWKRSGRVDSALESFGDGLRLEPRWARLWVEKGDLMKLRDPRGAKECYRMALRIHEAWKDRPLDSSEAFYVVLDPEIFKEATRGAEL
jgi:tetratricopeptide (TPR) repeat protein